MPLQPFRKGKVLLAGAYRWSRFAHQFCTIPEREIGAEMPVYGTYDAAFDEELRPYIENLNRATGLIECPQAYKLAVKCVTRMPSSPASRKAGCTRI